ncbi:hypothetical protein [Streptomyces sp. NPDC051776]|uniref:hypothetical protein n=1 Tax=Streptomyces sp. NPDC051776 TaxID=3155414 RepID=UPI003445518F
MPEGRLRGRRAASVLVASAMVVGLQTAMAADAMAGRGKGTGTPDPNQQSAPQSGGGDIGSQVQYKVTNNGSGKPMTSSSSSWSPPVCWFEPRYTNEELAKHNKELEDKGPFEGIDHDTAERRKEETDAYKGKKGMWYERTPVMSPRSCEIGELWVWVEPQKPAPAEAIDPEILAGLAYKRTELPAPPVQLRPGPEKQIVNLGTQVKFAEPLNRVWVTASLDNDQADLHIAATTVATPSKLRINAGTEYADPQTCEYDLVKGKGGYEVDSRGSDCNIEYKKSSGDGTYTLTSELVWDVHWTASADPDGAPQAPALPDGLSTNEQDVTVKEVQAIVR